MEGVEGNAVDGDPVRVFLRLIPRPLADTARQHNMHQRLDARTEHSVLWSSNPASGDSTHKRRQRKAFWYDHVTRDGLAVTPLKSYALGVLSGTDTTLLHYEGYQEGHRRQGFFDVVGGAPPSLASERHTTATVLFEVIVEECKRRGFSAYLSCAAIPQRSATEVSSVVDLCGFTARAVTPPLIALDPSCEDGTLFPELQCVNVVTVRSPADVLFGCRGVMTSLKDRVQLPTHATIFATLSVHIPIATAAGFGNAVRVARLTLVDIIHFSHLVLLSRLEHDLSPCGSGLTPFLQKPTASGRQAPHSLPLVVFGTGLQNRCVVVAGVMESSPILAENRGTDGEDRSTSILSDVLLEQQSPLKVLECLSRLRRIITASAAFTENLSLPAVHPSQISAWKLVAENMRLRRLANSLKFRFGDAAPADDSADEGDSLSTAAVGRHQPLLDGVPGSSIVSCWLTAGDGMGDTTRRLMSDRLDSIREMEAHLEETRRRWDERRRWLMSLPVVGGADGGVAAIHESQRMRLLERSVDILEEENIEQRHVFQRDLNMLLLEQQQQQQQQNSVEGAALHHPAMHTLTSSHGLLAKVLAPGWQTMLVDVDDVLRHHHSSSTASASEFTDRIVEGYADSLRHDLMLLWATMPAGPSRRRVASTTPSKILPFGAALQQSNSNITSSRRAVQLTIQRAIQRLALDLGFDASLSQAATSSSWRTVGSEEEQRSQLAASEHFWEGVVVERAAAQAERYRLRHAAEALALHARRMVQLLHGLLDAIDAATEEVSVQTVTPCVSVNGCADIINGRRGRRGGSVLLHEVKTAIMEEMSNSSTTVMKLKRTSHFSTEIQQLHLTIAKLRGAMEGLEEIALGYAEMPQHPMTGRSTDPTSRLHVQRVSHDAIRRTKAFAPNSANERSTTLESDEALKTPPPVSRIESGLMDDLEGINTPRVSISLTQMLKGSAARGSGARRVVPETGANPNVNVRRGYFSAAKEGVVMGPPRRHATPTLQQGHAIQSTRQHVMADDIGSPSTTGVRTPYRRL